MHRYWTRVLEPVLAAVRPGAIVEIGAGDGVNTRRLLQLAGAWEGVVHAIDPLPRFPVEDWEREFGPQFRFHRDLSLNALPDIAAAGAYLLDGDHNWYTVRQELGLIAGAAKAGALPFPLVFLHASGWPYARRDSYRDPRTIPQAGLRRFRRGGVLPGRAEPGNAEGLNADRNHSLGEGEPQTGVLTALEDFLRETSFELAVFQLPAFHGLTLMADTAWLARSPDLEALLGQFRPAPLAAGILEDLERSRVEAALAYLAERHRRSAERHASVTELNDMAARHQRETTDAAARHARDMKAAAKDHASDVRAVKAEHARALRDLTAAMNREIRARDRQNAALTRERDRLEKRARGTEARARGAEVRLARLRVLSEFRSSVEARVSRHAFGRLLPSVARSLVIADDARNLRRGGLVDERWYLATYPDVAARHADPSDHYARHGVFEGRDPAPGFSTLHYLLSYPDVVRAGLNPLLHYAMYGAAAGRRAAPAAGTDAAPRKDDAR